MPDPVQAEQASAVNEPVGEPRTPKYETPVERPTGRSVLITVCVTAFLDLVGFSIIFPLFPALLRHYVALEGPDSLIGRLAATLEAFAGTGASAQFLVIVLFGGLLGSIYSILQFVFAPIWGSISDRVGRRPALMFTLVGTGISYVLWVVAGSFVVLVVARLLGGIMAGNLSTISAAIADTTTPKERSRGMGALGASIGVGFIVGPAIGGISSLWDPTLHHAELARFGVNPFSGAALIALILSAGNVILAYFRFPETLPPERRGATTSARTNNPIHIFAGVPSPGVRRVNVLSFIFLTAFAAMEFTLTFLAVERFGYTPRDNAKMFVFVGVVIALTQGGVVRRMAPKVGDRLTATIGLVLVLPGFLVVGAAHTVPVLFTGLGLMAAGSALANPCLSALASRYAPEDQQGLALGTFRSMGALSRALGPLLGGVLYWKFGAATPYEVGAAMLVVPIVLSYGLPPPT